MKSKLIGNNIKRRRLELKLTQAQLAERAQISDVHISHIETGKASMSLETLLAICRVLDTTPNDILLGEYFYPVPNNDSSLKDTNNKINPKDQILLQQITHLLKERNE